MKVQKKGCLFSRTGIAFLVILKSLVRSNIFKSLTDAVSWLLPLWQSFCQHSLKTLRDIYKI